MTDAEWPEHRLYPKIAGEPQNFLDLGFGTSLWCAEVGQHDPNFKVVRGTPTIAKLLLYGTNLSQVGIDITSNMAIDDNPSNVELELQNLNEELMLSENNNFDFVRMNFIAGGISRQRWPGLLSDVFNKALKPDGMVQSMEWDLQWRSAAESEDSLTSLREWTRLYHSALGTSSQYEGRKIQRVGDIEDYLRAARFTVTSKILDVPVGGWSGGERLRNIGKKNLEIMQSLVETIATYAVVTRRICGLEDFKALVDLAKAELENLDAKIYLRLYVSWGKKTLGAT